MVAGDKAPQDLADRDDRLEEGANLQWFAVQVASGCEKKVKSSLEQRIIMLDVQDKIRQIEIPQTPTIKLRKDGSRQTAQEKVFPGYILIQMQMVANEATGELEIDDDAWQAVKSTPHVINFVGTEQKHHYSRGRGHVTPRPLSRSEVERIFRVTTEQEPVVKFDMAQGDKIKVLSGPFKDFEGEVVEVSPERSKLKALLSIFGRDTPVELEFNQVQKQN
ncbi:transcription termination/antitermination protein NusG [Tumidithrix helvetica PCC 7403]|uniref:transcription termination/antitermination protein NusG n=1 Tax=Tumidithrix helvetica TaxID=3457545 RepID=UPI003CC27CAC